MKKTHEIQTTNVMVKLHQNLLKKPKQNKTIYEIYIQKGICYKLPVYVKRAIY